MFHHRSGKLKQQNKRHKARRHLASKRAVKREEGGKINVGGGNASVASSSISTQRTGNKQKTMDKDLKQDRLNRARQAKEQKRQDLFLQRRIGSADGPPRVVALLPLSAFCDTAAVRDALIKTREPQQAVDDDVVKPSPRVTTAAFKSLKQRFTFLLPRFGLQDALEAARVADLVIFILDVSRGAEGAVAQEGDLALSALRAQGLPTTVGIVQGLEHHHGCKSQVELRRYGHRFFETEFGDKIKVAESINSAQLLRTLSTPTGPSLHWRQTRSYLVGEEVAWTPAERGGEGGKKDMKMGAAEEGGVLRVRGFVRGKCLNVDQLLHLPGVGTYAMCRILKAGVPEPCPLRGARSSSSSGMMEEGEREKVVLAEAMGGAAREEALKMWAEVDELAGEQTWPSMEEEMEGGGAWSDEEEKGEAKDEENEKKKKKKKLLKKMSEYQASWFEGDEDEKEGAGEGAEEGEEEDEEEDDDGSTDMDLTTADLQQQQQRKVKRLEEDELEFPDEVQTPDDTPAKERFARYRALKSFRTSPWDPYESLPREYARIYKFSNFASSHARVMSEMEEVERAQNQKLLSALLPPPTAAEAVKESGRGMEVEDGEKREQEEEKESSLLKGVVAAGTYVILEIVGVSAAAWAQIQQQQQENQRPLCVFSLLRYENKVSVLHFNIQKHPSFDAPLKSKERLLFYTGFRSFEARPVFSEHNLNCDKHKFSRYLHGGRFAVATAFGPVSMPPCPVLIFRTSAAVEEGGGEKGGAAAGRGVSFGGILPSPTSPSLTLVATGALHTVDPDRIILKRILLTGYPVRVKRRTAVVKHMFYNPEDVKWFKPAELSTKLGAAGHIKEPIGTHGLMKMRFNRIISQSDTICLPLFKRVFPKLLPGQQEGEGLELKGGEEVGEKIK